MMEVDAELSNQCLFRNVLATCNIDKSYGNKELSDIQKGTVINSSKKRGDQCFDNADNFDSFHYHTDCYSEYTSKQKISRFLMKRKKDSTSKDSEKRLRR